MNMNRKLFLTDLDDTLLCRDKTISAGNRMALEEARRQGHYMAICTGRAISSARKLAKELDIYHKDCFIISFNGSQIFDCHEERLIYRRSVPKEIVRFCFDEAAAFGINMQTYNDEAVLVERDNPDIKEYISIQVLPYRVVPNVLDALPEDPPKVLVVEYRNPEKVMRFRRQIEPKLAGKADIFMSHDDMMEIVPPGVNKGLAVQILCEHLGIPVENSVAAGDAENDLTMIQAAGVGCAMSNAEPAVKAAADYVTERDCDHDGVAEILERFVLNR